MSTYAIAVIFIVIAYLLGFTIGKKGGIEKDMPVVGTLWIYEEQKEIWFALNEEDFEVEHDSAAKVLIKIVHDNKQNKHTL